MMADGWRDCPEFQSKGNQTRNGVFLEVRNSKLWFSLHFSNLYHIHLKSIWIDDNLFVGYHINQVQGKKH